jgi:hypothetical protein
MHCDTGPKTGLMPSYYAEDKMDYALSGIDEWYPEEPPNPSNVLDPDTPAPSTVGPFRNQIGRYFAPPPPDPSNMFAPAPTPSPYGPRRAIAGRGRGNTPIGVQSSRWSPGAQQFGPWYSFSTVEDDFATVAGLGADDDGGGLGMLFAGIVIGGLVGFITANSLSAIRRRESREF